MPKKTEQEIYEEQQNLKDGVRGSLGKSADYHKKLKKIKVKSIINPFLKRAGGRILTGTALDRLLSITGGIEYGSSIELFGVYASGKTQVCNALAAEALKKGRVIYIDAENTFRGERFAGVCDARNIDAGDIGDRFLLYQPQDWIEQEAVTMNLPEWDEEGKPLDVRLIIIDSLMKHWASDPAFYGREKLTSRQQLVRAQMERLGRYARRHNAVFLFTNQVYDKPVDTTFAAPEDKIGSRGGRTVEHFADYRLFLRKGRGNIRFARLVDSPDIPLMEIPFILDVSGIADIPSAPERAKAIMMSARYGDKFKSGQVSSVEAGKEYKRKALELGYITSDEALEMGLTEKEINKVMDTINMKMETRLGDDLTDVERRILDTIDPNETDKTDEITLPDFVDKEPIDSVEETE